LPYDPTYHLLARPDKIRGFVHRERPDVLEIHSPYLALVGGLMASRRDFGIRTFAWHADFIDTYLVPFVVSHSPFVDSKTARALAHGAATPVWSAIASALRAFDATFVAAEWQRAKLEGHGIPNVVRLPFGVDKSVFTPSAASASRRRTLLRGAPLGADLIVAVGRFAVEKRWDDVLDGFARIRATRPAVLAVFGDGPERSALEARSVSIPDVHFHGFESDRAALAESFASADLLLHACPFETFGLAVAEATASGLLSVVPDQGGAREVVTEPLLHFRTGDARDMADAALHALSSSPEERKERALALARGIFDVREHFEALLAEYRRLLELRRRRP